MDSCILGESHEADRSGHGCSQRPSRRGRVVIRLVAATYISPIQYSSLTCSQIHEESARIANRAPIASGVQDEHSKTDRVVTVVGAVAFWSPLFFLQDDNWKTPSSPV